MMKRRTVLRGAGVALGLPWLEAMANTATAKPPVRMAMLYMPNGVNPHAWTPEGKGKEYFSDDLSYVGEYKEGKRHGTGYFVLANQSMCYVESINGRISGL